MSSKAPLMLPSSLDNFTPMHLEARQWLDTIWALAIDMRHAEDDAERAGLLSSLESAVHRCLQALWTVEGYVEEIRLAEVDAEKMANGLDPLYVGRGRGRGDGSMVPRADVARYVAEYAAMMERAGWVRADRAGRMAAE